jgi:hypothetical protein
MKKTIFLATLLVVGFAQNSITSPAFAQQRNSSLSEVWGDANKGFVSFSWLRAEDNREIYSSALYTEISQNTLSIYNTYKLEPFGKNARCGGLGCDLGKGQLVGSLKFDPKGSRFIVREASGKAGFLAGAQCRVVESYMKVLECLSSKTPASSDMPSIFRFAPGT